MYFSIMKIIWSNNARLNNLKNLDYLFNNWNLDVVLNYEEKLINVENSLISNPYLGQFDKKLNLYKILVVPQIYLFYELDQNQIKIINIWNNHKKPYW